MRIKYTYCEFGTLRDRYLECKKDNGICGYIRFCRTDNCIKHTNFTECKVRRELMINKKDEIEKDIEVIEIPSKIEEIDVKDKIVKKNIKTKKCKIIMIKGNKTFILFDEILGASLIIMTKPYFTKDTIVEVAYSGTYGKTDFEVIE